MGKRVQSPSSINTFKQCKRKYYYQYIEKLPVLPNIHQVRGNIAHTTLDKFYDLPASELTQENYKVKIRLALQRLFLMQWKAAQSQLQVIALHPDQERFYFEETMLMLLNWGNHFLSSLESKITSGLAVPEAFIQLTPLREQHFQSDRYGVRGFVDAIHQVGKEVHIIDYKTNNSFELKESIKLQLAIYSLLYFEKHGQKPSQLGIFFLRNKLKMWPMDEQLLELAKQEIELVHAHTARSEHIDAYPRTVSPLCKWSSGQCDFLQACKPFETEQVIALEEIRTQD